MNCHLQIEKTGYLTDASPFQESRLTATPIQALGLTIRDTPPNELISEFQRVLEVAGIRRLKLDFYLSTERRVPFEGVSSGFLST